jgi:hypothetical protein
LTKVCPECGQLCEDTEPNLCYNCTFKSGKQIIEWHKNIDKILSGVKELEGNTNKVKKELDQVKGFDVLKRNELLVKENENLKRHLDTVREFYDRLRHNYDTDVNPLKEEIKIKDEKIKRLEEENLYYYKRKDIVDDMVEAVNEFDETQKRLNELYRKKDKEEKS